MIDIDGNVKVDVDWWWLMIDVDGSVKVDVDWWWLMIDIDDWWLILMEKLKLMMIDDG